MRLIVEEISSLSELFAPKQGIHNRQANAKMPRHFTIGRQANDESWIFVDLLNFVLATKQTPASFQSSTSSLQTFARWEDLEPFAKGSENTKLSNAGHWEQSNVTKTQSRS